jgi:replicative DNA helicase
VGVDKLFNNIEEGKKGRNIGISTGMTTIDSVLYGIQRKYLYTIGADTSG